MIRLVFKNNYNKLKNDYIVGRYINTDNYYINIENIKIGEIEKIINIVGEDYEIIF